MKNAIFQSTNLLLNNGLAETAKQANVVNLGAFENAGYRGLYRLSLKKLERVKGVSKEQLLDNVGSVELAANLFRITQTEEKIKMENIQGQDNASRTHFSVGSKVRQTIKDIGGLMPEKLPVEKHIKELKKVIKKLKGGK